MNSSRLYNADVCLPERALENLLPVKSKTLLDILAGRCNQPNSKYYLTTGTKESGSICPTKSDGYPEPAKFFAYKAFGAVTKDRPENYAEKQTYKSRLKSGMRKRLAVDDPADDIRTMMEIDPFFYSIVEGRPLRISTSIKEYVEEMKNSAVYNLVTGYLKDEVLKFDENLVEEEYIYKKVCEQLKYFEDVFEKYLSETDQNSKSKLKIYNDEKMLLLKRNRECRDLDAQLGRVTRRIFVLEEKNRFAKTYQEFLYHVSPHSWCVANGLPSGNTDMESIKNMFKKYQIDSHQGKPMSLMRLIEKFEKLFENSDEPKLYFTDPWQVKRVLRNIEIQNLTHWSNLETFTENTERAKVDIGIFNESIEKEFREMNETITGLRESIESEVKLTDSLRSNINEILHTVFYDILVSEEVLKLNVCVRQIYEKLVFSSISFETLEMMRSLECEYESNMARLDRVNLEVVAVVKKRKYAEDANIMRVAREGARKLRNLEKIITHLKRAQLKIEAKN